MNTEKDKDLKNRIRYSSSFDIKLLQRFKALSKETDVPVSKLFDRAMKMLLDSKES
ncbi:ribbon-helix-helix domain-containing protein [Clostridium estertheticum]|uniref:Ribbon-helix-helix domain-containing protein n=1 Tax=Clostridium estertheticum TaxID=238834 RepID=A0A5N7IQ78_9CLOT|nr:ribbon-helix-helix domain-containing protein [Clostridium estertheticum]MBU3155208.1 ribbon-helix-helix domain-containing protein [Clostridium estertheticum]MBZ9615265.1 ribbon-helix-helix domain-containing protein [Clostridium estertheticum subsp. laramiense]MPQ32416.1 ribbon-helix-helix domain-containing protein [Clostridium estertheticum]MPQ63075.1 ribbon-helix-helix domain-containing protein [Clostridium estertheticum]WAG61262.1 ribbon-helix-helix domain-containing protein [Clostridium 